MRVAGRYRPVASQLGRQRLRQQRRALVRAVGLVAAATVALLLYVWQHVHAQQLMREIAAQEKRLAVLTEQVTQLEATRASLLSFDRVTATAAQKFQLGFYQKRNLVVPPAFRPLVEQDRWEAGGE